MLINVNWQHVIASCVFIIVYKNNVQHVCIHMCIGSPPQLAKTDQSQKIWKILCEIWKKKNLTINCNSSWEKKEITTNTRKHTLRVCKFICKECLCDSSLVPCRYSQACLYDQVLSMDESARESAGTKSHPPRLRVIVKYIRKYDDVIGQNNRRMKVLQQER